MSQLLLHVFFLKDLVRDHRKLQQSDPEEVAGVALFLACDYTSFVNGQTIVVDGGETIR